MAYEPIMAPEASLNAYGVHEFQARITFGSSSIASAYAKDLTIARNSAGNYTVTLPKPYRALLGFSWGFQDASGAILFAVITSETVDTTGAIVVEVRTEAGTATDPTSGDKLFLAFRVSSDTLNDKFVV